MHKMQRLHIVNAQFYSRGGQTAFTFRACVPGGYAVEREEVYLEKFSESPCEMLSFSPLFKVFKTGLALSFFCFTLRERDRKRTDRTVSS